MIDRRSGRLIGYLADLTTGGAMLIGEKPIETNTVLYLRMDLPDDFAARKQLDFDAQVIWCRPDDDPDFYKTGLKLLGTPPEDIAIIERVLGSFGFNA